MPPHNFVRQHSQTSEGTPLRPTTLADERRDSTSFRFVYFGTPEFSISVLEALAQSGFTPSLIVTAPDKPAGRGLALSQSPVKTWAIAHGIEVLQPEKFDDAAVARLAHTRAEFAIVAAYGKILPQCVLDLFPRGAVNVHPSLLPRYRGMSPVESQILADDTDIGVSVILMDEKMDHGPILAQEKLAIPGWPIDRNAANDIFWKAGGKLLAETLPPWLLGDVAPTPQDENAASLTKKITKEDGLLDLSDTAPARAHYLKYLAYHGWPGTYFFHGATRVKITRASFVHGAFIVERVIPEGKREMDYVDFSRKDS